jgi:two-component system sensor histidine kinase BaeS
MALVGLVCFMAIVFSGIALASVQFLLGHAVNYVEEGFKQQWNRTLTAYYMQHQSWEGVQEQVSKILDNPPRQGVEPPVAAPRSNERFYVFDVNKMIVASSIPQDVGMNLEQIPHDNQLTKDWTEIDVNGNPVGYFWVDEKAPPRQNRLAQSIGKSIVRSMLIGLILTTLLALVLGSILTGRLTGPLKELTFAVRRVGKGELSTHLEVKGNDDIAMLGQAFNQMTEQLERNEEVRRNMVADIAHELRTPLAIISGKLESIQEGVLPLAAETLLPIQDETIRLSRLVQDLQQLSLAEAGKLPLHRQTLDMYLLLERIFEQFAFEFEERGIEGKLLGESQVLQADSDRLTQVFVNLIGNALLHTSSGGKITVKAEPWEANVSLITGEKKSRGVKWIQVTVNDTGEGIPADELDRVFDRFYRVDQSRDRETGGTGLGLAIAKEFVQAHGGKIQAESEIGRGTCFRVLLPVDQNNYGDKERVL